jgi:hypothetical protein
MIVFRNAKMLCGMSFPSGDITNLPLAAVGAPALQAPLSAGANCPSR